MKRTQAEIVAKLEKRYETLVAIQNWALKHCPDTWYKSDDYRAIMYIADALNRVETPISER